MTIQRENQLWGEFTVVIGDLLSPNPSANLAGGGRKPARGQKSPKRPLPSAAVKGRRRFFVSFYP